MTESWDGIGLLGLLVSVCVHVFAGFVGESRDGVGLLGLLVSVCACAYPLWIHLHLFALL